MEVYFFVPGNRLQKIGSILGIYQCNIIIDMEDAVKESEREAIVEQLVLEKTLQEHYIRIPLYDFKGVRTHWLEKLLNAGYSRFVFPKIDSVKEFETLYPAIENHKVKIILLVESPRL